MAGGYYKEAATDLPWLQQVPAVQTLRQGWAEPYTDPPGPLRWREVKERVVSAEVIASPSAPEARYGVTAQTQHQIDVVGPPFGSYSHQRRAGPGYDLSAFLIDWGAQ